MKKVIIILISILAIAGIIIGLNFNKIKDNLKPNPYIELGYSKSDLKVINTLKNPDIILKYKYDKNIIAIIKNKDFAETNLPNYLALLNSNLELDDIILIGNKYYDENITYTNDIVSLMKEKYYIHDNLERYLKYRETYDKDNYNLVLEVNANLDKTFYVDTEPADLSKENLILVNKFYYLDKDYMPDDLVLIDAKYGVRQYIKSITYEAYKTMWEAASNEGLTLYINSPYRSYNTQSGLYNNYAARDGISLADTYSARPGFSEHQTGLAFDVTSKTTNFDNFAYSNEYKWLQDNAYKYGFILRYPKGKEYITGYQYESWHYRYVGKDIAKYIHDNDITYEEYYAYFVK